MPTKPRLTIVLTQVQVGRNARHRLQPPDILISFFALALVRALESAHKAIYGPDGYLRFGQAVCLAEGVDLRVG